MTAGLLAGALIIACALVGFEGWLLYLMVRQQGKVLLSQEELRTRVANAEAALERLAHQPVAAPPCRPSRPNPRR